MDDTVIKPMLNTRVSVNKNTRRQYAPPPRRLLGRKFDPKYALLSLGIGTLLWFGVDTKRQENRSIDIPIEFKLPDEWKFTDESQRPRTARITVRGSRQAIDAIHRRDELRLEPVFPEGALTGNVYNNMLALQSSQVRGLPAGLEVQDMTPEVIPVSLNRITTKQITVKEGDMAGTPQDGYRMGRVLRIDPPSVKVSAPHDFLSRLGASDVVRTKPLDITGRKGAFGLSVGLEPLEKDGAKVKAPGEVYVTLELEEIPTEREFSQPFEVRALIDSALDRRDAMKISPPSVKVTVAGPQSVIDKLSGGEITIYADMRERVPVADGEFTVKCRSLAPSWVRVIRIEPDTVKWLTREAAVPDNNASAG
ncbi:MAG: hypothetical protein LBU23_06505 [Planctomycetota bacterium]|jgi:hypothetical protein|nr:hypothetical protein [Planctomycetota bacterium]